MWTASFHITWEIAHRARLRFKACAKHVQSMCGAHSQHIQTCDSLLLCDQEVAGQVRRHQDQEQDAPRAVSRRESFKVAQVIDHRLAHGASSQGYGPQAKQAMAQNALSPLPEELHHSQVGLRVWICDIQLKSSSRVLVATQLPPPPRRRLPPPSTSSCSQPIHTHLTLKAMLNMPCSCAPPPPFSPPPPPHPYPSTVSFRLPPACNMKKAICMVAQQDYKASAISALTV